MAGWCLEHDLHLQPEADLIAINIADEPDAGVRSPDDRR